MIEPFSKSLKNVFEYYIVKTVTCNYTLITFVSLCDLPQSRNYLGHYDM